MKKYYLALAIWLVSGISNAAENSLAMEIRSIESRDSGAHSLYFTGDVPSQGCTHNDRAVIVETSSNGAKTLLSVALTALTTQKNVTVRVDGCALTNPSETSNTYTSPRVIKLLISR